MRVQPRGVPPPQGWGCRRLRLDRLPLRPVTARTVLGALPEEPEDEDLDVPDTAKTRSICELDPGWMLVYASAAERVGPLESIAETPWWPAAVSAGTVGEILGRLWRYSVAVSIAAGRLAHDAGDPEPDGVARAGLLCRLGWWAVAAHEPAWLVRWWHEESLISRRQREIADFGTDLDDLGRRLAERWGCDPLVTDAAWLHGDHGPACTERPPNPPVWPLFRRHAAGRITPPGRWAIARRRKPGRSSHGCESWWLRFKLGARRRLSLPTPLCTKSG